MTVFRIIAAVIVFFGAQLNFDTVWAAADVTMGFMALINLPVIVYLSRPAMAALKDYTAQIKAGKDPEFKAASIGLDGKTEFWN